MQSSSTIHAVFFDRPENDPIQEHLMERPRRRVSFESAETARLGTAGQARMSAGDAQGQKPKPITTSFSHCLTARECCVSCICTAEQGTLAARPSRCRSRQQAKATEAGTTFARKGVGAGLLGGLESLAPAAKKGLGPALVA